jgi:OOP family OmpA-OmpF porin
MGLRPDPARRGCPQPDRDGDGVIDSEDQCPDVPKGARPDSEKPGCPTGDRDFDGVFDPDDQCPDDFQGPHPDPKRPGCPLGDRDHDGVFDPDDQCPDEPKGDRPDPLRTGCPQVDRDRDGDSVMDSVDACPDQPGVPSTDPQKHGCPSLVVVKDGKLAILEPVFFATNKDVILERSYPVLQSVADVLKASPDIHRVLIEGHTDNRGKAPYNLSLSERRAQSVMRWLVEHGVGEHRLVARGFGSSKPITSNDTAEGRERNRRVEFVIIDPPQAQGVRSLDASQVQVPSSPDQSDVSPAGRRPSPSKKKGK